MPTGVGSEVLANQLFSALVGAENAAFPPVSIFDPAHSVPWTPDSDIFKPVTRVTTTELVACFQALLGAFKVPLEEQARTGRITNADFAKTYVELSQAAMQGAVQFMLGKDQAYWLALKTQADAVVSANQNELTRMQVMVARAQFALTKLQLSEADSQFGVSDLQRTGLIPAQVTQTQEQSKLAREQTESVRAQTMDNRLSDGLPVSGQLGAQKELTAEQTKMTHEQAEAQRAQTLDARMDGLPRTYVHHNPDGSDEVRPQGLLGVQKSLYIQQICSYRDDTKQKFAQMFKDLWMTQKTIIDETQPSAWFRPPVSNEDGSVAQTTPLDGVFREARKMAMGGVNDGWTPVSPPPVY